MVLDYALDRSPSPADRRERPSSDHRAASVNRGRHIAKCKRNAAAIDPGAGDPDTTSCGCGHNRTHDARAWLQVMKENGVDVIRAVVWNDETDTMAHGRSRRLSQSANCTPPRHAKVRRLKGAAVIDCQRRIRIRSRSKARCSRRTEHGSDSLFQNAPAQRRLIQVRQQWKAQLPTHQSQIGTNRLSERNSGQRHGLASIGKPRPLPAGPKAI